MSNTDAARDDAQNQHTSRPMIVVMNDSKDLLRLMKELLEGEGYAVEIMHAAEGAYDRIREIKPDLVILDIVLEKPDSGWQLLQILKLGPQTGEIPVIICSADIRQLQARQAQLAHMNCLTLPKPFDIDELLGLVGNALGRS